jgi:hypothetical protein
MTAGQKIEFVNAGTTRQYRDFVAAYVRTVNSTNTDIPQLLFTLSHYSRTIGLYDILNSDRVTPYGIGIATYTLLVNFQPLTIPNMEMANVYEDNRALALIKEAEAVQEDWTLIQDDAKRTEAAKLSLMRTISDAGLFQQEVIYKVANTLVIAGLKALWGAVSKLNKVSTSSEICFFNLTEDELNQLSAKLVAGPSEYFVHKARSEKIKDLIAAMNKIEAVVKTEGVRQLWRDVTGFETELFVQIDPQAFDLTPHNLEAIRMNFDSSLRADNPSSTIEIHKPLFSIREFNAEAQSALSEESTHDKTGTVRGYSYIPYFTPTKGGALFSEPLLLTNYDTIKSTEHANIMVLSIFMVSGSTFISDRKGNQRLLTIAESAKLLHAFATELIKPPRWLTNTSGELADQESLVKAVNRILNSPSKFWLFARSFSRPWYSAGFQRLEFYRHWWKKNKSVALELGIDHFDNIATKLISDLVICSSQLGKDHVKSYLQLWSVDDEILSSLAASSDVWILSEHLNLYSEAELLALQSKWQKLVTKKDPQS